MSQVSAVLSLPYLQAAQAQKHVTHNEALRILDVAVQLAVSSRSQTVPPANPDVGTRHIVPVAALGDWAGQQGRIAVFDDGAWSFQDPLPGWSAQVLDEGVRVVHSGTGWVVPGLGGAQADWLGLNTVADAENRLSVAAPATLLSHEGAGHQLKVNKAAAADTASLLFQTGFSGRAEMGLAGTNEFSLKVSVDGIGWITALLANPASGLLSAPVGVNAQTLTLAGSQVLARSNLLGTVSQSGGVPTGAVIQRGSNANGEFVRLADGTQICTVIGLPLSVTSATGAIFFSGTTALWTYPAAFVVAPVVVAHVPGSTARWATASANASQAGLRHFSGASSATDLNTAALAVGRWF